MKTASETSYRDAYAVGSRNYDRLIQDDELGYETQATTVEFSDGPRVSHIDDISGWLEAGQSATYRGEIYLEAQAVYHFYEHSPTFSELKLAGRTLLADRSVDSQVMRTFADDTSGTVVVDQSGYYDFEFTVSNSSLARGYYALAISTGVQRQFLVMKGETGAPVAAISGENLTEGAYMIGSDRSDDITASDHGDLLLGGFGNDRLVSGSGDDVFVGGANLDTYVWGADTGHDLVVYTDVDNVLYDRFEYEGYEFGLHEEMLTNNSGYAPLKANKLLAHIRIGDDLVFTVIDFERGGWNVVDSSITIADFAKYFHDQSALLSKTELVFPTTGLVQTTGTTGSYNFFSSYKSNPIENSSDIGNVSGIVGIFDFFSSYEAASSSDAKEEARESYLGAAQSFQNGSRQADTLETIFSATGDISAGTADELGRLALDPGVSWDTTYGTILRFTGNGSGAELDIDDHFFGNSTDLVPDEAAKARAFSFATFARFDDLRNTGWQDLFRIEGTNLEALVLKQVWGYGSNGNGGGDDIRFSFVHANQSRTSFTVNDVIDEGEWAHWGVTFAADGTIKLYKNGAIIATQQYGANFTPFTVDSVSLGNSSGNRSMDGAMYNTIFYNEAVSDDKMLELSMHTPPPLSAAEYFGTVQDFSFTFAEDSVFNQVAPSIGLLSTLDNPNNHTVYALSSDDDYMDLLEAQATNSFEIDVTSADGRQAVVLTNSFDGSLFVDLSEEFITLEQGETDTLTFDYSVWDSSGAHLGEVLSGEVTVTVVGESDAVGEWGTVSTGSGWMTVQLERSYTDPVVIAFIETGRDMAFAEAQVKNVRPGSKSFDIRVQETEDYLDSFGTYVHRGERLKYLVLEAGEHTLSDGTKIYAGNVAADAKTWKQMNTGSLTGNQSDIAIFSSVINNTATYTAFDNRWYGTHAHTGDRWLGDRIAFDENTGDHFVKITPEAELGRVEMPVGVTQPRELGPLRC